MSIVFDSILGLTTGWRDEKPSRVTIQEITPCEHGHRAARLSPPDSAEYGAITGDGIRFALWPAMRA
jgi:hypothetical protein